jgi:hypothetical protein
LYGRKHPAMARDQLAIFGHHARHGPAELCHARRDLGDLVGTMGLGVAGIRLEARDQPLLDALCSEAEGPMGRPVEG